MNFLIEARVNPLDSLWIHRVENYLMDGIWIKKKSEQMEKEMGRKCQL